MKRRALAILLIVLVAALMLNVSTAFAASSTKTVYVISSMSIKDSSGNYSEKISFKYNDNGLLKSYKGNAYDKGTFKYSGKKLKSADIQTGDGAPTTYKYTWKDGKITKAYDSTNYITTKFKYNSKGQITKITATGDYSTSTLFEMTYKYDSKKRIKSEAIGVTEYKYKYNSKGRLTSFKTVSSNYTTEYKYKNTVKNGRVTKIVRSLSTAPDNKLTVTVKYKAIKVPSANKTLVKKQQNQILMDQGYMIRVNYFPLGML